MGQPQWVHVLGAISKAGRRDVGQAFQPDISAAPVRLESLTYAF
jgi:hypothetical protein